MTESGKRLFTIVAPGTGGTAASPRPPVSPNPPPANKATFTIVSKSTAAAANGAPPSPSPTSIPIGSSSANNGGRFTLSSNPYSQPSNTTASPLRLGGTANSSFTVGSPSAASSLPPIGPTAAKNNVSQSFSGPSTPMSPPAHMSASFSGVSSVMRHATPANNGPMPGQPFNSPPAATSHLSIAPSSHGSSVFSSGYRGTPGLPTPMALTPTPPSMPNPVGGTRSSFTGFSGSPATPSATGAAGFNSGIISFTPPPLTGGPMDQILRCHSCDIMQRKLHVVCETCMMEFRQQGINKAVIAFCDECNKRYHSHPNHRGHKRHPFYVHTGELMDGDQATMSGIGVSQPLCRILCENCDEPVVTKWCHECSFALCDACSAEIHRPAKQQVHPRVPFEYQFVIDAHLKGPKPTAEDKAAANAHHPLPTTPTKTPQPPQSLSPSAAAAAAANAGQTKSHVDGMSQRLATLGSQLEASRPQTTSRPGSRGQSPNSRPVTSAGIDSYPTQTSGSPTLTVPQSTMAAGVAPPSPQPRGILNNAGSFPVAPSSPAANGNNLGAPENGELRKSVSFNLPQSAANGTTLTPTPPVTAPPSAVPQPNMTITTTSPPATTLSLAPRISLTPSAPTTPSPNPSSASSGTTLRLGGGTGPAAISLAPKISLGGSSSSTTSTSLSLGTPTTTTNSTPTFSIAPSISIASSVSSIPTAVETPPISPNPSENGDANGGESDESKYDAAIRTLGDRLRRGSLEGKSDVNNGTPGSVLVIEEPELTGKFTCKQLVCENKLSRFDAIGNVNIVAISCGSKHAAAVTALGTLFVWGHHSDHQLGIPLPSDLGSDQPLETPTICKMPDDRAVRQVACGWTHTIALTQDGCVFTWGSGRFGILGHGGEDKSEERPKQVILKQGNGSGEEAVFVACGQWSTGVVVRGRKDQKQMYVWGAGGDGQLGNGKHEPELTPYLLGLKGERPHETYKEPGLVDKIFKALDENGDGDISSDELEHWLDENHFLEMGESSQFTKEVVMGFVRKIDVNGDGHISREELEGFFSQFDNSKGDYYPEVKSMCFGMRHTVCCTKDGHVYTWGNNEFGQLGYEFGEDDAKIEEQLVPRLIRPLSEIGRVAKIEAGEFHCSALTSGGDLYSWGSAETHQIGVEGDYEFWEPVQAKFEIIQRGARGRLSIVAGMYEQRQILEVKGLKVVDFAIGHSLSCAVTEAGEVWMWGFSVETPTPQRVEGLKGNFIQRICAGSITNIIALTAPVKDLYVWDFQDTPEEKPTIKNDLYGRHLAMISAGKEHYAGVTTTGHLLLWGSNKEYQLALGMDSKIDYREVPEVVEMKWVIKDVQCGHEHTLALTEDGKVLAWGNGTMGQLGLRDRGNDAAFPTLVESIATKKIISIAVGAFNSAAITSDHKAYIWGSGEAGQIGNEKLQAATLPQELKVLRTQKIRQISFGNGHVVALTRDGNIYTWGKNEHGQLGQGKKLPKQSYKPLLVPGLQGKVIKQVACGDMITLALTERGAIWGWGNGETFQLGPAGGASKIVWAPVPLDFPVPQSFPSTKALETKDGKTPVGPPPTSAAVAASPASSTTSIAPTLGAAPSTPPSSATPAPTTASSSAVAEVMTIEDMDPAPAGSTVESSPAKLASGGRTAAAKASPKIILRPKVGGAGAKKPIPPPLRRGTTATKLTSPGPAPAKRLKPASNDDDPKVVFTDISSAAIDCAALSQDGLVYVWGWNFHEDSGLPQLIGALRDDGVKIANISMGKSTLLLST